MFYEFLKEEDIEKVLQDLNINNLENINIDINAINIVDENNLNYSSIIYFEDKEEMKLNLVNAFINIKDPEDKCIYSDINALEKLKEIKLKKNIKTILNIDINGFKLEKKNSRGQKNESSKQKNITENLNKKEEEEVKDKKDKFILFIFFSIIFIILFSFFFFIFIFIFLLLYIFIKKEENKKNIEKLLMIDIKSSNNEFYNKNIYKEKFLNKLLIIIDISGNGVKKIIDNLFIKNKNFISIFNLNISTNEISKVNEIYNSIINMQNNNKLINKENDFNDNINQIKSKKREIFIKQKTRENNLDNNEKIKYLIEDMCILGKLIKNEIKIEQKNNPDKYITIQEATKDNKNIDELFCLGLLAKNLENFGITIAIEKKSDKDEESIYEQNTILQFILNGLMEKKKYEFHFDFGEERNNELLNNEIEREKFHKKLKEKFHIEYNIPEENIIIMNPQKGSYQVNVIFLTEEFNDNINIEKLKEKCQNDKEFKEISYLKKIHKSLIMEGCKLSQNMLDSRGNKVNWRSNGQKRGGFNYYPPTNGWKGFGIKVFDKYDNGNNDWINCNGNENEWAVAYHGTGVKMGSNFTLEKATNSILSGGFKPGWGQAYANDDDAHHPGKKVGIGVYCSPNPYVMESYARCAQTSTNINGINFMMGFMMRVKPDRIRYSNNEKDYWVLNGTTDEMRPYRIMVKAQGVEENDGYLTYIDAMNRRNNVGMIFSYNIKGSDSGTVWGDHIYTDDSNICKSAVLEGLCNLGEEKIVRIKILGAKSSYSCVSRNGISSQNWGYWEGSYIFV